MGALSSPGRKLNLPNRVSGAGRNASQSGLRCGIEIYAPETQGCGGCDERRHERTTEGEEKVRRCLVAPQCGDYNDGVSS